MTPPKVRIEVVTLDDDGQEHVDVLEAVDHTPEPEADEAPSSGVLRRAPREAT